VLAVGSAMFGASGSCGPVSSAPSVASPVAAAVPAVWDAGAARHVLDRFAFGPRPGDVDALVELGFERWLAAQLAAPSRPDPALDAALEPYASALQPPAALVDDWVDMTGEPDMMAMGDMTMGHSAEAADMDGAMRGRELQRRIKPHFRAHLADLVAAQLTRQVLSERQIEEVMIDFWSNHFNIFAPKGMVRSFAGDYVERVLRPLALGRFEDLLLATARHPAMLIYLDNAASTFKRGLNENYARELLELHTLGVGAYHENDVPGVARILTGWGVSRPGQPRPYEFAFRWRQHDFGAKTVLDETYPAGEAEAEGVLLLKRLATHPATARHIGSKLCMRFVADDPPPSCVEAAEAAFMSSGGELRQVIAAIAHDPSFWQARRTKLKRPLELAVSALRATAAELDGTSRVAQALRALGEPMLEESVPTGYPEDAQAWASSGGFLARMSFATGLGFERLKGVSVDVDALLPETDADGLLAHGNRLFLSGAGSAQTLSAIASELARLEEPHDRRCLTAALFLGSPEFQTQ